MNLDPNLLDLGVVLLFSFLGVLISARLKLPSVVGVLFFGMLIGPHAFGLIQETEITNLLFEIGAILLLFFIGLEFNIDKISRFWLRASFVMVLKFGIIFVFTYIFSVFFGLPILEAIIMGLLLSFSSTAVFARFVAGTPQQGRPEAQMMSAVLILEDIFAVFLLTLLPQLKVLEQISLGTVALPVLISLAILFFFYVGLKRAMGYLSRWMDESNTESQLFLALSLCAALAFLASSFGLSASIGAFFAGSAVSAVPLFKRVEGTLQQLFILFSAFFFFAIGMQVDPLFIYGAIGMVLAFTALNLILKFFAVASSTYIAGYDSRGAFFSALVMLTVSEFALLISTETGAISSFDFVSFSAALIVLTSLVAAILYPREASLNFRFNAGVGHRMTFSNLRSLSVYLGGVFKQFESGGEFYQVFLENSRSLVIYATWLVIAVLGPMELRHSLGPAAIPFLPDFLDWFTVAKILLSIYPIYKILSIINILIGKFSNAFYTGSQEKLGAPEKMSQDAFFAAFFFFISILIPVLLSALELPSEFQVLALVPMGLSIIFIWDLGLLSTRLFKPVGKKVSLAQPGSREAYEEMQKHQEELRAKQLRRQEEATRYLLAPITMILGNGKKQKSKSKEGEKKEDKGQAPKEKKEEAPKEEKKEDAPGGKEKGGDEKPQKDEKKEEAPKEEKKEDAPGEKEKGGDEKGKETPSS